MLYSQIICNDNVLSAVSFRINLWSAPASTPVPSDESFVWKAGLSRVLYLKQLCWSCYLCRNLLVTLGCAPQPPPFPSPLHSSDCWSLGGPRGLTITTAQITAADGGPAEVAAVAPGLCITENLTTFIISDFFSHQPHFLVTFLLDIFMFARYIQRKNRSGGSLFKEENSYSKNLSFHVDSFSASIIVDTVEADQGCTLLDFEFWYVSMIHGLTSLGGLLTLMFVLIGQ